MRQREHFVNVSPYLPHALAATTAVVIVPTLLLFALMTLPSDPSLLIASGLSFLVAIGAATVGTILWNRRPESADIAFGELMIWGWLQRKRADRRLDEGARLLGLDRKGQPTEAVRIPRRDQLAVLHDLNAALESKDPYTHGHSQRVARHTYRTAVAMGLSIHDIEDLRLAALLHDVGKIRIPDRILRKPDVLTPEERTVVEEHTVVGSWMVSTVGSADVVASVRHHHERWDGLGYPDGLARADIPLFARIISVADAYDAITSTRPYRPSAGREEAVSALKSNAGTQFDPLVVDAFVEALPLRLPVAGALVLLAGPGDLIRRLAVWFKRLGAGNLAPAAATLSAAVLLGGFVPTPSTPPSAPRPAPRTIAAGEEAATLPVIAAPRNKKPEPAKPEVAVVEPPVVDEGDIVLGVRETRKPKPAPEEEEPVVAVQPAEPEDDDGGCVETDENGRGLGHEKGKGKGHAKHCD